jgi:hypothetical protein
LSGMPSSRASRPLSTGNLLADCERWCRDELSPRAMPRQTGREGTALRVVAAPLSVADQAPYRRGTFRPGPGWPGIPVARTAASGS